MLRGDSLLSIGVDSGWAAGASAPPIIQEEGHCPTNNLGGGAYPPTK